VSHDCDGRRCVIDTLGEPIPDEEPSAEFSSGAADRSRRFTLSHPRPISIAAMINNATNIFFFFQVHTN